LGMRTKQKGPSTVEEIPKTLLDVASTQANKKPEIRFQQKAEAFATGFYQKKPEKCKPAMGKTGSAITSRRER